MEAEERPAKLRKLSHDTSPSTTPFQHVKDDILLSTTAHPEVSATQDSSASNSDSSSNILEIKEPASATDDHVSSAATSLDATKHIPTGLPTTPGLSKNQLKKQKKKAEWEAGRENRKAIRREKDKAKKARRREARDEALSKSLGNRNATNVENNDTEEKDPNASTWTPRKNYKSKQRPRVRVPIAFVLDCSFDSLMTEKEIISLGSQLTRCYSDNTKAPYSAHLYISSWNPDSELRKRFEGLMRGTYRNWKGINFTETDFIEASKMAHAAMTGPTGGKMSGVFKKYSQKGHDSTDSKSTAHPKGHSEEPDNEKTPTLPTTDAVSDPPITPHPPTSPVSLPTPPNPQLLYLTSDSPHTLTDLSPYTTYIIGGLVDKNRHKSLCYNTAVRLGIPTAKLPLAQYMKMTSREVLATNHVVEIMLRWLEVGDWGDAFLGVLPKRKGAVLRGNGDGGGEEKGGGGDDEVGRSEAEDLDDVDDRDAIDDDNDNDSVDGDTI